MKNINAYSEQDYQRAAAACRNVLLNTYVVHDNAAIYATDNLKERVFQYLSLLSRKEKRHRNMRNIAAAIIVVLLTAGIILASNAEARDRLLDWIQTHVGKKIVYFFEGNAEERSIKTYLLSYIPDGFEVFESTQNDTIASICYFSEDMSDMIVFTYGYVEDGDWISVQSSVGESLQEEDVFIHGLPGQYYHDRTDADGNTLLWFDAENNIVFQIDSTLDRETILKMAESIYQ